MNTRKSLVIYLLLVLTCPLSSLYSQNAEQRIKKDIFVLASDSLKGRSAGTKYGDKAAKYIFSRFKENGLNPKYQYITTDSSEKNIYCVIEGSDPVLKNEFIILGAHYDHLGYKVEINKGINDTIVYNGADDNASGTVAILELGKRINENRQDFKRSIVLIAFDAEETGLNGSAYFANSEDKYKETTITPNTKMMMSLDMVGYLKTSKELKIVGIGLLKDPSQYFSNLSIKQGYNIKLKEFDRSIFTGSDHDSFLKKDIPAFYVTTGLKSPYHKPEDDAEGIDIEGINDVSNYIYGLTKNLANANEITPSGKNKKKSIPLSYWGMEFGIGSNEHYYTEGRMTGKTDFACSGGFFGRISLSNHYAIKTGLHYNYLEANRNEGIVKYHNVSVPALFVLNAGILDNDIDYAFGIGAFYDYIFNSKCNSKSDYLNKNVVGIQFEIEMRFRKFVMGFQSKRGYTNMLNNDALGKTNQISNMFKIGFLF